MNVAYKSNGNFTHSIITTKSINQSYKVKTRQRKKTKQYKDIKIIVIVIIIVQLT